jgi:ATP-dependent DNA helicase RecG
MPEEVQALVTAEIEGEVSNRRMQEICDRHPSALTKILQGLVRRDFLSSVGQGRGTRYTLPGREGFIQLALEQPNGTTPLNLDSPQSDSPQSRDSPQSDSPQSWNSSQSLSWDSSQSWNSSQSLSWDSSQSLESLPPEVLEKLKSIASIARASEWLHGTRTRSIILQLCNQHFLTAAHLAELMNRNSASLRSRFLTPMVREGLLQLLYPDKPNRPDQAYRTVHQTSGEE